MLLWFFPDLYFETTQPFLEYEVIWPPLYVILDNLWYSLILAFGVFLVIGSQSYAQTYRRWAAAGFMILAVMIVNPLPFSSGPTMQQLGLLAILGGILTLVYLKWDFLTVFLTHFLFSCLLVVSSGWIIENSPDFYVFVMFILFMLAISIGGVLFIAKGKEVQALSNYVPEYVEELAQEDASSRSCRSPVMYSSRSCPPELPH
ncbi:MAG: hypothetical protein U5K69_28985 [Balneolaceae bacterium]|nr:hypothetical protein [Balneolaceae bacterium]